MLPNVGVASAVDLGDPDSPWGDVHFRNKQAAGARAAAAIAVIANYPPGATKGLAAYPPPSFLSQNAFFDNSTKTATMRVTLAGGDAASSLVLLPNASVSCPSGTPPSNCTCFEVLGSDGGSYEATSVSIDSTTGELVISAVLPATGGVYGVGTAYAWSMWPRILIYGGGAGGVKDPQSLPILPWRQALTIGAMPSPPPTVFNGLS